MSDESSMSGIEEAVQSMLQRTRVSTPEEAAAWEWRESIAPRLQKAGFDSRFHKSVELHGLQLATKLQCDALLRGQGAIVALVGIRGTGKTTIAAQIAVERIRAWLQYHAEPDPSKRAVVVRPVPWYFKAAALVSRYKPLHADFGSIDSAALQTSLEELPDHCGLIVIDEWHECDDQRMRDRVLVDLIDRFYSSRSDVLIISNQDATDFATKTNASILSRLDEHGQIIPCKWKSFRTK